MDAALSDPHGFAQHGKELMIIDEVQRAPMLLQAVKKNVDEFQDVGRFLLTGPATSKTRSVKLITKLSCLSRVAQVSQEIFCRSKKTFWGNKSKSLRT
ncbi:MAG: hypothetical protein BGO28_01655 [Alphaproteobacteria bacterium 43-37]|nr:MAG: hypothetical protein BGO28_01655 [Alphaproteobacteria bacterium 43-37]